MRILIATPLYPPDIAPLAVYVKELAKRLREDAEITILAYAHIPEKVDDVRIVSVEKNSLLIFRLVAFIRALLRESRRADVLYIQNGSSVEVPALLIGLLIRKPFVIHLGDTRAFALTQKRFFQKTVLHLLLRRATHVVHDSNILLREINPKKTTAITTPQVRPEIFPFAQYPRETLENYEHTWEQHLQELKNIFNHAKR